VGNPASITDRRGHFKKQLRNLPLLCILESVFFAAAALGLPYDSRVVNRSDLSPLSGSVMQVWQTNMRGWRILHILASTSSGVHELTVDERGGHVPELDRLRVGHNMTALVERSSYWVWEVNQDHVLLLSYEQSRQAHERVHERLSKVAHWAGIISPILLFLGVALRLRFGAWSSKVQAIPARTGPHSPTIDPA
jgi:hypothetical protein